jgi:hypothetical protein
MRIKTRIQVVFLIFLVSLIVSVNVSAEVIKTYNAVLDIECTDGFVFHEQGTYTDNGDGTFNYSATGLVHDHFSGFGTNIHSVACNGDINIEPFGQLFKITNPTTNTCTGLYGFSEIPYSYALTDQVIICDKTMESCQYYDNQYNDEVITSGPDGYCRGRTSCTYSCSRNGTLLLVNTETVVGPMVSYEFEDLTFTNSDGTTTFVQSKSDSNASSGMYFLYQSNAVGEFVTFPISVSTVGTYNLNLQYHLNRYRGTFLVEVSDNPSSGYVEIDRMDTIVASGASFETLLMMYPFMTTGTKYLRFRVTGSNPNTGSERMGLDKIDVILQ